jgi:Protein of unknown function (DUF3047)
MKILRLPPTPYPHTRFRWLATLSVVLLAACATPKSSGIGAPISTSDLTQWTATEQITWHEVQFPAKSPTSYSLDTQAPPNGSGHRTALKADAQESASMLRTSVRVEPDQMAHLAFSWLVPALMDKADMAHRDLDDSPVRVVLAFEGDRSTFSPKNAMLNELARLVTGEEMPYATLMYVWCNQRPVGSVIQNPRTDRIRKIVVESGPPGLNQWRSYERDIREDFERAFGEAPGALVGIGLMTDSDNTHSNTVAWYGPIALR